MLYWKIWHGIVIFVARNNFYKGGKIEIEWDKAIAIMREKSSPSNYFRENQVEQLYRF